MNITDIIKTMNQECHGWKQSRVKLFVLFYLLKKTLKNLSMKLFYYGGILFKYTKKYKPGCFI